ncbi:MAG: FAD-dependent thymidylate synthase, partial [Thermoplasmata archaeon]
INEYSARYSVIPDEFDLPEVDAVRFQSLRNRQGGDAPVPDAAAEAFRTDLARVSREAYDAYERALAAGVARETARLLLPLAYYTEWYWKIDLHNLLHFLALRLDPHAQEEIRRYAAELARAARAVCPIAFEAFEEFLLEGVRFSRREQAALQRLLEGLSLEAALQEAGLPTRKADGTELRSGEAVEFKEKLARIRRPAPDSQTV